MQYTYDDFLKAANGAGLLGAFSQEDLNLAQNSPEYGLSMLKLHQDDQAAETAEQHLLAQEAMNQLRQSYSGNVIQGGVPNGTVIGSGTGTEAPTTGQPASGEGFQWDKEDSYRQLLEGIVNRQPFEYDHESDPRWSAYKKGYTREGERATADALAQASAATGGVPSSWAVTAATQAGDYFAGQLSDKIPELYGDAYNRHLAEIGLDIDALGALQQDKASGWNDYLRQYEMEQQKFNNALALYQALGYMTPEIQEALGLSGSEGGGTVNNGSLTEEQIRQLQGALGVTVDGQYGPESMAKADGLTAEEAYERFVGALNVTDPSETGPTEAELAGLLEQHPEPVITDGDTWDEMVAQYGEETLKQLGYSYESDGSDYTIANQHSDSSIKVGDKKYTYDRLMQLITEGKVKEEIDHENRTIRYTVVQ